MNRKHPEKRGAFSGKLGYVLSAGRVGWSWKYMEISVSGSKIRRRNFPARLYSAGTDIRIYDDRCGVRARTYDAEKSGWCVSFLW